MKVILEMEAKDFRRFESIKAFAKLLQEASQEEATEPAKAEPAKAEPAKAEPAKAEPAKAEPAKADMQELKKALKEYCVHTEGGAAKVKAAMSKRGLVKASDATPEQLSEILEEVKA